MKDFLQSLLRDLSGTRLADLGIRSPFTIPSGIVTTVPSVIARIAREVPEIGFLTTKTLSVEPREGYREPVLYEYYPGCFVNAVGLANPGAADFRDAIAPLLPLADRKPLVASIMGGNAEEFLECVRILEPVSDAFELNLSCPHVKGAGQSVGSDQAAVRAILRLLKGRTSKPVIPKLSPNLGDIAGMARLCEEEGADGLALINTVGPGMATDAEGNPVLSNIIGGVSGAGVLPLGLKAVKEAAAAVSIPIIACGGIGSAVDLKAYRKAGALLFGIGSALAGMTTPEIAGFFAALVRRLTTDDSSLRPARSVSDRTRTAYFKTTVIKKTIIAPDMFQLEFEKGLCCDPGQFFFLRLPGIGEKPFSPARDEPPFYLIRTVGPFTSALANLEPGAPIFFRGPYGKGFPQPQDARPLVLLAGGTGSAPIMMAARRWTDNVARAFFGFSKGVRATFFDEVRAEIPQALVVVDPPDRLGEVVRALAADMKSDPRLYEECLVYACGPAAMTEAAREFLLDRVPVTRVFIAREDVMRCGIGVCGSCGTPSGLRSCVDGPVMRPEW
jgi:dihydroorotate dehydrogenase (NAD+) catalytic subunit